jgi:hypothetical protein
MVLINTAINRGVNESSHPSQQPFQRLVCPTVAFYKKLQRELVVLFQGAGSFNLRVDQISYGN